MARILIVDDNEQNLYMLRYILESHDHKVVSAANGSEALEKARQDPPDTIVTDILMPVMDGFALCREWKEDKRLKGIPLVFYTATYTDPKDRELGLSLGAERFIVKPTEPDVFLEMLREVLEEQEAGRLPAPRGPVAEEAAYFGMYNEALIRKLEDKMFELQETNQALERDIAERKRVEAALRKRTHDLGERVKELNCLYGISNLVRKPGSSLEQIARGTVDLIPPGWQYPGITCARIMLKGQEFTTQNFRETIWRQTSDIMVYGERVGAVQVCYLEERPESDQGPFLKEERYLINAIAEQLGRTIEHKRSEEALARADKLRALAQAAGGIAHELNNVLVRMRASADLALMDLEEDPQSAREEIESVISGATDAARVVRRLEVLYQRADDLSDFVPLQLDALVREALTLVRPRWRVQGFTDEEIPRVRTNLTQPPLVWSNPDELVHVLARFLGNAIQAMPRGGTLSVATGHNDAWSFVTASDTDRGIRSEVEGDAFEPFYTTRSHMADELGMVTAINIIERHGGETLVESKPGVGTSFTLRLPMAEGLDGDKGQ